MYKWVAPKTGSWIVRKKINRSIIVILREVKNIMPFQCFHILCEAFDWIRWM